MARTAPDEWTDFIERTDLIVKGTIVEQRLVYDDEGWVSDQEGKIEIVDIINFKNIPLLINSKKIYIGGLSWMRERLGDVGYFFIYSRNGKWVLADPDAAIWKLVNPNLPKARKYREGDAKEIKFPQYLENIPESLIEENKILDDGSSLRQFSEKKLIEYFLLN